MSLKFAYWWASPYSTYSTNTAICSGDTQICNRQLITLCCRIVLFTVCKLLSCKRRHCAGTVYACTQTSLRGAGVASRYKFLERYNCHNVLFLFSPHCTDSCSHILKRATLIINLHVPSRQKTFALVRFKILFKQDRHCTYNVTLGRVRATTVAVENR